MIIKNIFAIIGVIATLIGIITGGQQIYDIYFSFPNLPIYDNAIFVTSPVTGAKRNAQFIHFLEKNNGKTVYLSLLVDFNYDPVPFPEQKKLLRSMAFLMQKTSKNLKFQFL